MIIGLTGAHRTGKTTLAEKLAHKLDLPFVPTSTSSLMIASGFDPKLDYCLHDRVWMQERILDHLEQVYRQQPADGFVTDRTPLDAIAYMLADVTREGVDAELAERINRYVGRCYDILNRHFSTLLLIPPAIELKDEPGKAPANPAYITHIHFLILGAINSKIVDPPWAALPSQLTSLDDRIHWAMAVTVQIIHGVTVSRKEFEKSGGQIH